MNKKQQQEIRNNNYREFVDSSKSLAGESRYGVVRINTTNTLAHERKKFEICFFLKVEGRQFLTECRFKNGSRADVYDLDDNIAYEIICSESKESIKSKQEKYPVKIITIEV